MAPGAVGSLSSQKAKCSLGGDVIDRHAQQSAGRKQWAAFSVLMITLEREEQNQSAAERELTRDLLRDSPPAGGSRLSIETEGTTLSDGEYSHFTYTMCT